MGTKCAAVQRGIERMGTVALFTALVVAVLLAVGVGSWSFQLFVYRAAGPVLMIVAALLAWQASRQATLPGARRHWWLMTGAFALTALEAVIALVYSTVNSLTQYPLTLMSIQVADMVAVVLAVIAVLAIPVRVSWSTSRLRRGLDLATVMLSAAVFLVHFSVVGMLGKDADLRSTAPAVALIAGCLVGVFAVARVALAGAAGIRRGALIALAAAGLTTVVAETLTPTLIGTSNLRVALSLTVLFYACVIAAPLVQIRAQRTRQLDHGRRGRPFSTLPFAAVAGTQALLVAIILGDHPEDAWRVLAGVIGLTGLVVARQIVALRDNSRLVLRLDESLAAQHQAIARSQVLADTGTALMTAPDARHIYQLAADAGAKLLASHPANRTIVIAPIAGVDGDRQAIAVANGAATSARADDSTVFPWEPLRARLSTGAPLIDYDRDGDLAGLHSGLASLSPSAMFLPLQNADQVFGVLAVDSESAISAATLESLDTLRTQVTLALERITLTVELTRRALHDPLTGLANRALIHERIAQALAESHGTDRHVGVLLLDLNGFKQINDTLGHHAGDELLREVAHRLHSCMQAEDFVPQAATRWPPHSESLTSDATVGRLGGDEFVVVAKRLADVDGAHEIADRITASLTPPVSCAGQTVSLRASIGVALSGQQLRDTDEILRHADAAMYAAKRRVAGGYQRFAQAMTDAEGVPVTTVPAPAGRAS